MGHFVLDYVLHFATLWGTLYWTVCYTVLPFWDIVYRTVCLTVPPDVVWILIMLFADDVLLASDCVAGLQRQIDVLKYFADLYFFYFLMTVNMSKTKITVFRNGRFLADNEV